MFSYRESIVSLKKKYLKNEAEEGVCLSQPSMNGILDTIAKEGCSSLLEEVFLDLEVGLAPSLEGRGWSPGVSILPCGTLCSAYGCCA